MPEVTVDTEFIRAELDARIALKYRMIENTRNQEESGKILPDRIWLALSTIASSWMDMGVCLLLLGNRSEAIFAFKEAAQNYQQSELKGNGKTVPVHLARKPELAVLSRNLELAREVSRLMLPSQPDMRTYTLYGRALRSLILGESDLTSAQELTGIPEDAIKRQHFYPAVGEACLGIATKNADQFNTALECILDRHVKQARTKSWQNQTNSFLCITGTALALLAIENGINVQLNEKFHHVPTTLLGVFTRKNFKDKPEVVKIPVDLIPLDLLA